MAKTKHKAVKFTAKEMADDLPPELDFSRLKFIGRGPRAIEVASRRKVVILDKDVAKVFRNESDVNEALRSLIKIARTAGSSRKKIA